MKRNFSFGARKSRPQGWSGLSGERKEALDALLQGYRVLAGELLQDVFGIACCLPASHVTIDVLAHFGFKASALSVRTDILNPAFTEALKVEGLEYCDLSQRWLHAHPEARVTILGSATAAEWNSGVGHTVAIAENHWLIDASLGQANAVTEDVGIHMDHVLLSTVTENFLAGRSALGLRQPVNGCRVQYSAFINDQDFLQSPAWHHPAIPAVTDALIEKLENVTVVVLPDDVQQAGA